MSTPLTEKSSIEDIRRRFDHDVERFSRLDTGQQTTIDAPLAMELITQAAGCSNPDARRVLDIGCGAGNNTLKLLQVLPLQGCDLLDLSKPMLERAQQRLQQSGFTGNLQAWCGDFRELSLPEGHYDIIIAAAVFHHLRDEQDWRQAFGKVFRLLRPGGSLWITDLVSHEIAAVQTLMWQRYGDYLGQLGGEAFRHKVFNYIDREDSPRPLTWQLRLLSEVGFSQVEILHKNSCFAAYGAVK